MKILNINKFHFRNGGADSYYLDLGAALRKKGHTVIDFAMHDKRNEPSDHSKYFVSHIDLQNLQGMKAKAKAAARMIYSREATHQLEQLIKDTRPDIAHIHNIYHQISPSIFRILKKYHIPTVMTVHDFKLICPTYNLFAAGSICEKCKKHRYYQAALTKCNQNSRTASAMSAIEISLHKATQVYERGVDRFIASTQFVKDKLVEFGQNAEQITVIPMGVAAAKITAASSATKLPIKSSEPFVLFVGRLHPTKGVDILLRALQAYQQTTGTEIATYIIGSGEQEVMLKELATTLSLKKVHFLGQQNRATVYAHMHASSAVIVPSTYYETFGLTAAEAMAAGKPVIASNHGSLAELIQHDKTGLLFPAGNFQALAQSITTILKNPSQAATLGAAAQAQIRKKYDIDIHMTKLVELYTEYVQQLTKPE